MRILLSNDDGIKAQGLHILGRILAEIAEVYIAAPAKEQSGAGHGITVHRPLYASQAELPFAAKAWAISGLPADCVKLALEELLPVKPDLAVSGINNGPNLGNDIIYSGTVAAGREGFLYKLPAICVSVTENPGNLAYAAKFTQEFILNWHNKEFKPRALWNINVPGKVKTDIKGWRFASMGWLWYEDVFSTGKDEKSRPYYLMGGQPVKCANSDDTDVETCAAGYISLTPLSSDFTDYGLLKQLRI